MLKEIHVTVREGQAFQTDHTAYLTGDGEFWVVFDLEDNWKDYPARVARFQTEGGYQDVLFRGDRCQIPAFTNARKLEVGLYAGNIRTTTPARIFVRQGIRSVWGPPADPAPSLFDQLLENLGESDLRMEQVSDGVRLTLIYRGGEKSVLLRNSEVYVGSGEMPEGYRVQLDPTGGATALKIRDQDGNVYPVPGIRGEKGEKGDPGRPGRDSTTTVNGCQADAYGSITLTAENVGALSIEGGTMLGAIQMGGYRVTGMATPYEADDAANKSYVDGKHLTMLVSFGGDVWQGDGPYTYEIACEGVLASDMPHICPMFSNDPETARKELEAWGCVSFAKTENGKLILTCLEQKPQYALRLQVEVNR